MREYDMGHMMISYDIVIGILVMLASGKIGSLATVVGTKFGRYTEVSVFTLGACILAISGSLYLTFFVFNLRP